MRTFARPSPLPNSRHSFIPALSELGERSSDMDVVKERNTDRPIFGPSVAIADPCESEASPLGVPLKKRQFVPYVDRQGGYKIPLSHSL